MPDINNFVHNDNNVTDTPEPTTPRPSVALSAPAALPRRTARELHSLFVLQRRAVSEQNTTSTNHASRVLFTDRPANIIVINREEVQDHTHRLHLYP